MNQDLLLSKAWKPKPEESLEIFTSRVEIQKIQLRDYMRQHGKCYMVKFGLDDVRPMWEDQIDSKILIEQIKSPTGLPYDCPLCQPYDNFDIVTRVAYRRYLTKIVHPSYLEGFIDSSGVWQKCACLLKGEERKWLKFIKRELK